MIRTHFFLCVLFSCLLVGAAFNLSAVEPAAVPTADTAARFEVREYVITGSQPLTTDALAPVLAKHTGTNVDLKEIVQAASDLESVFRDHGYPAMCVAIAQQEITNGVVTLHVYQGVFSQIMVSGVCYLSPGSFVTGTTNAGPGAAAATNAEPRFAVHGYEVTGNTLLTDGTLQSLFLKYTGDKIGFTDITHAVKDLQMEYHNRGYDTISVTIPQQRLTNGVFKIRVFEGKLAEIVVTGNRFYSSNNVMRALPGLRTNMILNSKLLQPELDLANANQDRQIYPEIRPGPETNTTSLFLKVKDRLPLHAKVELNNQSSPGTPELRINTSIVYNDLWQADHSLGAQYSFSPTDYKMGKQWDFYDQPLVANYSAFYRMPLAAPESMADAVASRPGSFGYNEATRKFELPPASAAPELNVYASRSTIDTGVTLGTPAQLASSLSGTIDLANNHQDLTINEGLGFRLSDPLPEFAGIQSHLQAGLDLKSYKISSFSTNDFIFTQFLLDTSGNPFTRISVTPSPVPATVRLITYLPLSLRWDADRPDKHGSTDFGLSYSPNLWFSGGRENLENIASSAKATGYWHVLSASLAREQTLPGLWKLALRADGQWASEPLISNEQFGVGGVNGVRGYREGEQFGDTGWRVTSELKTPQHRIGFVGDGTGRPLLVRASVFMDYAETYLLDPNGRNGRVPLWGTGIGGVASVSPIWEVRLLLAWPLLNTSTSEAGQIRLSFAVGAQF